MKVEELQRNVAALTRENEQLQSEHDRLTEELRRDDPETSGEVDAYLHVACADGQALGDLRERLANVSGVAEITTAPVLRTVTRRIGP